MSNPKVVFEPVLGRWRVEYRTRQSDEWQTEMYASTLEEACEIAQEMTTNDLDGAYRVVDTQPDVEGDLGEYVGPIYTVEFRNTRFSSDWRTCFFTPRNASEAYECARAYVGSLGDQTSEEGRTAYRVVRTDADGAKIAQEVTPDGLGPLNPLNRLWVEKMEREDAARATTNDLDGAYRVVDTQPKVVVEAAPSRWRVDVTAPIKQWAPHALFNSREAAEAYAEALVKRSALLNLMARVVNMDPSDPVTVAIFEEDNV